MKRITILSVIMTILSFSPISAQNISEKEITFQNGTIKGVFAKGRLQSGKIAFHQLNICGMYNPNKLVKFNGIFEGTFIAKENSKFDFDGILTHDDKIFKCYANFISRSSGYKNLRDIILADNTWIGEYDERGIYKKKIKNTHIGISDIFIAECYLNGYNLVDKIVSRETESVKWYDYYHKGPLGILLKGRHSIYYINGNIYIGEKGAPGEGVEYIWANGDKYEGYAANRAMDIEKEEQTYGRYGSFYESSKVDFEEVNRILSTDKFPHYITRKGCFKLKDGREIKIETLYDIYDCESKEKVYSASQLSGEGKTPSEIVAIRDSVVLAQEAKKQRLEEEKKRRLEEQEEKRRQGLIRKYGEEIASLIEKGEIAIGMTKEMVLESIQNKKKIYDITYDYNQEYWRANRNKVKKFLQYEVPKKSAEDVLAETLVGAMFQSLGLSEDYMKALFKYDYLEFRDNILVGFSEWQDREDISNSYYNAMSLFGL